MKRRNRKKPAARQIAKQVLPQPGDAFTIAGVHEPDRRWWKRVLHWLLRRPPPRTAALQGWVVTSIVQPPHAGQ